MLTCLPPLTDDHFWVRLFCITAIAGAVGVLCFVMLLRYLLGRMKVIEPSGDSKNVSSQMSSGDSMDMSSNMGMSLPEGIPVLDNSRVSSKTILEDDD